jgi:hypothetical protein
MKKRKKHGFWPFLGFLGFWHIFPIKVHKRDFRCFLAFFEKLKARAPNISLFGPFAPVFREKLKKASG